MKPALTAKNMFTHTFDLEPHLLAVVRRFFLAGADFNECERVLTNIQLTNDWFRSWYAKGERFEKMAAEAAGRNKLASAREFNFQAFFFYRLAAFPLVEDTPGRREAYEKTLAAFRRVVTLDNVHLDFIEVPVAEQSFPGYLSIPPRKRGRAPVVVYIPGADCRCQGKMSGTCDERFCQ